jgi:hypothetical protein
MMCGISVEGLIEDQLCCSEFVEDGISMLPVLIFGVFVMDFDSYEELRCGECLTFAHFCSGSHHYNGRTINLENAICMKNILIISLQLLPVVSSS